MASADLLKQLLRGHVSGDDESFVSAAREIIEQERKKQHNILADDLSKILANGDREDAQSPVRDFRLVPKDQDRDAPLMEIRRPVIHLEDLVLADSQVELLRDVADQFRQWDVLTANGLWPSRKLLFCGPPGCGKTVTAEALASLLGLPLLVVRFDAVVSSLLGETASNLAKVFDYARTDTWVVLFDEFDAVGRSRDDPLEHGELKRVVNAFLQMLDTFYGRSLIVAATNFAQALDPALWRRFDEILRFDLPNREQIRQLVAKKLRLKLDGVSDLEKLVNALDGMSHGEVERVCLDALKKHILDGGKGSPSEHLEIALKRQAMRTDALSKSGRTGTAHVDGGLMNGRQKASPVESSRSSDDGET